jgi:hypothetical protein
MSLCQMFHTPQETRRDVTKTAVPPALQGHKQFSKAAMIRAKPWHCAPLLRALSTGV